MFYATYADMVDLLSFLEALQPLQYTRTGMFPTREPQTVRSYKDIPGLGVASHPTAIVSPAYLLSFQGETVESTEVPRKAGGVLFTVHNGDNHNTINLRPGGRYGDNVILCGSIATISTSQHALLLYKIVSKQLRQKFRPVEEYWVGAEAMQAWKAGARLTVAVQSPPMADLGARGGADESEPD